MIRPLLVAQVPRMGTCHPPSPMVGCYSPNIFAWDLCRVGVEEVWDFVWICVFDPPRVQHDTAPGNMASPKRKLHLPTSTIHFQGFLFFCFREGSLRHVVATFLRTRVTCQFHVTCRPGKSLENTSASPRISHRVVHGNP